MANSPLDSRELRRGRDKSGLATINTGWDGDHTAPEGRPTGNSISLAGHDLLRVRGGQIVEHWTAMDSAELMQQLGQG